MKKNETNALSSIRYLQLKILFNTQSQFFTRLEKLNIKLCHCRKNSNFSEYNNNKNFTASSDLTNNVLYLPKFPTSS